MPALSADRFYEPGYLEVIRRLGFRIIDYEGPVTFDHLATRIARAHGLQRTGGRIRQQVEAAIGRQRSHTKGIDGERIYWPTGRSPEAMIDRKSTRLNSSH